MREKTIKIYYLHLGDNIPFYVGKTKDSLNVRLKNHRRVKKLECFIEEIESVENKNWKFWESYWIEQFKSWGFNLTNKNNGGGGLNKHSPISRSKLIDSLKKVKRTEEWRKNLSLSLMGKKKNMPSNYGEIISNAKKGIPNPKLKKVRLGKPHPKSSYVILCFNLNGDFIKEYPSSKEAGKDINKHPQSIRDAASGIQKTAYGFIWKYKKDFINSNYEKRYS
jgi:hypothetical protein